MKTIPFNINDYVRVKLTDHGRKVYAADFRTRVPEPAPFRPIKEDADGWSVLQLWSLMDVFGKHCVPCELPPFNTTVELVMLEPEAPAVIKSCLNCAMRDGDMCLRRACSWKVERQVSHQTNTHCDKDFSGWIEAPAPPPKRFFRQWLLETFWNVTL
jgi:hypothetical protein